MISMIQFDSPIGELHLVGDEQGLTAVHLPSSPATSTPVRDTAVLAATRAQLTEYFAGTRQQFDLPLAAVGTPFQMQVWRALAMIPFGTTWSYGELARMIGNPTASRAVGAANGRNPIAIIVPCHRVIGADGSLTGYAGGTSIKQQLLVHERKLAQPGLFDSFPGA